MASQLSPYRLIKAREVFNYFNIISAISWNLLVGIIITLFALRLEASSTFIGLISGSAYFAFFMLPIGKIMARRFSIIGIYSFAWIMRSVSMTLAVIAPILEYMGHRSLALFFVMLGVFLFHIIRGVGLVGNNPILSQLASGPDRGSYLTQLQIMASAIGMFGSFLIAMVLGMEPPIFIFSILLSIGVVTGVISGYITKKLPEPPMEREDRGMKLIDIFKDALSQDELRHFMSILFFVVLVSGVTRTFIVVYAREVFAHSDGLISLYSVFGGLGYLIAGLSVKFLIDRLGAKPLFLVGLIVGLVCLFPVILFPRAAVDNVTGSILFMVFMFFMLNFSLLGSEGITQTYYLALIPEEKMLDLGILYYFIFGTAGAAGAFLSGIFLDLLRVAGITHFISFKILFSVMAVFLIIALAMQKKMKSLGSLSLKNTFEVIFSFRELRVISLLDKLNKAQDSREEELLLGALHDTPSHLAIDGLLERARSPRLATRIEAIRALEKLEKLNKNAEKALIEDIDHNPFTTAYISARILGNNNCTAAIPRLRELASSGDYMLAGEAIIALARMKDDSFRQEIEKIILYTENPRLRIMGAEALGLYHNAQSIPVLLSILQHNDPPPYLRDEVILAIATILDTQKKFYKLLTRLSSNSTLTVTLALDEVEAAIEFANTALSKKRSSKTDVSAVASCAKNFHSAVSNYAKEKNGAELSRWILELPVEYSRGPGFIKSILSEAVLVDELSVYDCLRLLIIHWAAQELRIWAAMVR